MTDTNIKALFTRGFRRAALSDTNDILLSFEDESGEERWVQLPFQEAGALAAGLFSASNEAAKRRGEPDIVSQKQVHEGLLLKSVEVSASLDADCAVLTINTVSGLALDFPVRDQMISDIRVGLRKAEALLNQGRRRGGH
jgi:hypothetical protein